MKVQDLVNKLLETEFDDSDPKDHLLDLDPEGDLKDLTRRIQSEGLVIGYKRTDGNVKIIVRPHKYTPLQDLVTTVFVYLRAHGFEIQPNMITTSYQASSIHAFPQYILSFPMHGPDVPFRSLT